MAFNPLFLLDLARRLAVLGALLLAGWSDYRTREVSDLYWVLGAGAAAPLLAYLYLHGYYNPWLHLASFSVAAALALTAYLLRITGEADVLAILFIGVFEPPACHHPFTVFPIATVTVLSGAVALAAALHNACVNVKRGALSELKGCPAAKSLLALLALRYVSREEFRAKSYMLIPSTGRDGKPKLTLSTQPEDPPEGVEKFWASVLLPYVSLLAVSFLAYTVIIVPLCT